MRQPSAPPGAPTLSERARMVLEEAGGVVLRLLGMIGYLWRRPWRPPSPRVGFRGAAEAFAWLALVVGLVAAAMLLFDPLVLGIRQRLPAGFITVAERVTDLGLGGVVLWPLGLAILYVLALSPHLDDWSRKVAASVLARLGFLFFSIAIVSLSVSIIKHLLGRARPYVAAVLVRPDPQLTFDWLAWKSSFASFPSGHATTVFATAAAFSALFPKARRALVAVALIVAATRVLLGSHFPSDVIAGAAVGTGFVLWMVKMFAARRVVFAVDSRGHVVPKAGPSAARFGRLIPPASPGTGVSLEEARS